MTGKNLCFVVIGVLFTCFACSSDGRFQAAPESVLLPSVDTYPVVPRADFNLEVRLSGDGLDEVLFSSPDARALFTVWAYDELVADGSATEILTSEYLLRPQDVDYSVRFNREDLARIEYQSGVEEAIRYYLTAEVDVDANGEICDGDMRQDLGFSRPAFYPTSTTDAEIEVSLAEVFGEPCP